jgi:hypothetical protein
MFTMTRLLRLYGVRGELCYPVKSNLVMEPHVLGVKHAGESRGTCSHRVVVLPLSCNKSMPSILVSSRPSVEGEGLRNPQICIIVL